MREEDKYYNHPRHAINSIQKHYGRKLERNERKIVYIEFSKAEERNNSRIEKGFFDDLIPVNIVIIENEPNTSDLTVVAEQCDEIFDANDHNANTNELSTGKTVTRFSVIILATLLRVKVKELFMNLIQIFNWNWTNRNEAIEN